MFSALLYNLSAFYKSNEVLSQLVIIMFTNKPCIIPTAILNFHPVHYHNFSQHISPTQNHLVSKNQIYQISTEPFHTSPNFIPTKLPCVQESNLLNNDDNYRTKVNDLSSEVETLKRQVSFNFERSLLITSDDNPIMKKYSFLMKLLYRFIYLRLTHL